MIDSYISALLEERDIVVIPDFGGLITKEIPTGNNEDNRQLLPARKVPEFNPALKDTPSELPGYMAAHEGKTEEEATELIAAYIGDKIETLNAGSRWYLDKVGSFRLDNDNEIVFEPAENTNYLGDSFGLPAIEAEVIPVFVGKKGSKSVKNTTPAPAPAAAGEVIEEESSPLLAYLAVGLTVLLIGAAGAFWYFNIHTKGTHKKYVSHSAPSTEHVADTSHKTPVSQADTHAEHTGHSSVAKTEKHGKHAGKHGSEEVKKVKDGSTYQQNAKWYVVLGQFSSAEGAYNLRKKLLAEGYSDAEVLDPPKKSKLYWVTLTEAETEEDAKELRKELQPKFPTQLAVNKRH
ncbi:MAG: SPOR domain-containing protein [Bacteroidota bacterium]